MVPTQDNDSTGTSAVVAWRRAKAAAFMALGCLFALTVAQSVRISNDQGGYAGPRLGERPSRQARLLTIAGQYDLVIFRKESCYSCQLAEPVIRAALRGQPGLAVLWANVEEPAMGAAADRYAAAYGIASRHGFEIPAVFIGGRFLSGYAAVRGGMPAALRSYRDGQSPPPLLAGAPGAETDLAIWHDGGAAAARGLVVLMAALLSVAIIRFSGSGLRPRVLAAGVLVTSAWVTLLSIDYGAFRPFFTLGLVPMDPVAVRFMAAFFSLGGAALMLAAAHRGATRAETDETPSAPGVRAQLEGSARRRLATAACLAFATGVAASLTEFAFVRDARLPQFIYALRHTHAAAAALAVLGAKDALLVAPLAAAAALGCLPVPRAFRSLVGSRLPAESRVLAAGAAAAFGVYLLMTSLGASN